MRALTTFYKEVILINVGDVDRMANDIMATFYHYISTNKTQNPSTSPSSKGGIYMVQIKQMDAHKSYTQTKNPLTSCKIY